MKIKNFIDTLSKDKSDNDNGLPEYSFTEDLVDDEEKVVYIDDARVEVESRYLEGREILASKTQWSDQIMGDILIELGKLTIKDVGEIVDYQREKGLYFGEAAIELGLINQDDVLQVLSAQFGYTYGQSEDSFGKEMVMASAPFESQAEEFRTIRSQLLANWLNYDSKILSVVSPEKGDGRSYVAANLALAFSQLGKLTLLIDADMRAPSQHEIFQFSRRIGLSMLLAGRVKIEDMASLPDQIPSFQHLSVLGCGAIPPNPVELLSQQNSPLIFRELEKYFDVIIVDTPSAEYRSDVLSIATIAGSALLVTRAGRSKMDATKELISRLDNAGVNMVGAILNEY